MSELCKGCDLYKKGHCTKWSSNGKAEPYTRDWLDTVSENEGEFISLQRMCRKGSIFGNTYIGLTLEDIERLKNGEIIHIPGEYGTFIGLKEVNKDG